MSPHALALVVVAGSYLSGSIPFGLLLARRRGVDIRQRGSGNIGATNVARTLGKRLGAVVLLLDALKGAVPVAILLALGLDVSVSSWLAVATGLAAILGHCFPVWLRLRGGKGVATALGVLLVVDPGVTLGSVVVFGVVVAASRIVSLGSLAAAAAFPAVAWMLGRAPATLALGVGALLVLVWQHRPNIGRLRRGTEPRF